MRHTSLFASFIITLVLITTGVNCCSYINGISYCCPCGGNVYINDNDCCCEDSKNCPSDKECCEDGTIGNCCLPSPSPSPSSRIQYSGSCYATAEIYLDGDYCTLLNSCSDIQANSIFSLNYSLNDTDLGGDLKFYIVTAMTESCEPTCYKNSRGEGICGTSTSGVIFSNLTITGTESSLEVWSENPSLINTIGINGYSALCTTTNPLSFSHPYSVSFRYFPYYYGIFSPTLTAIE